jgi:hypothetical protein
MIALAPALAISTTGALVVSALFGLAGLLISLPGALLYLLSRRRPPIKNLDAVESFVSEHAERG